MTGALAVTEYAAAKKGEHTNSDANCKETRTCNKIAFGAEKKNEL